MGSAWRLRKSSILSHSRLSLFPPQESANSLSPFLSPTVPISGTPQLPAISGEVIPWTRTAFLCTIAFGRVFFKGYVQNSPVGMGTFGIHNIPGQFHSYRKSFLVALKLSPKHSLEAASVPWHGRMNGHFLFAFSMPLGSSQTFVSSAQIDAQVLFSIWEPLHIFINISCVISFLKLWSKDAILKSAMHLCCSIKTIIFVHNFSTNQS